MGVSRRSKMPKRRRPAKGRAGRLALAIAAAGALLATHLEPGNDDGAPGGGSSSSSVLPGAAAQTFLVIPPLLVALLSLLLLSSLIRMGLMATMVSSMSSGDKHNSDKTKVIYHMAHPGG